MTRRSPGASATLADAQRTLAAQPFSHLLGTRMTRFGADEVVLEIPIRQDLNQQNGYLHGGVLAYAADNALTFAAGAVLGQSLLTSGMRISYLRPALGHTLRAHATVVHAGRRQAVCRCDLYILGDHAGPLLCAAAQGTAIVIDSGDPEAEKGEH
jgi:uncharacterized protein (TIGR00369 family)